MHMVYFDQAILYLDVPHFKAGLWDNLKRSWLFDRHKVKWAIHFELEIQVKRSVQYLYHYITEHNT